MDASAEDGGAAVAGALEHLHELTRAALGGVDGDELWGLACERAADALGARWAVRAEPDADGALISGVGLLEPGSVLPECPVVILSGFEASLAGEQAREAGADRYLCKGVDPDTIVSVLYEVRAQRAGTLR